MSRWRCQITADTPEDPIPLDPEIVHEKEEMLVELRQVRERTLAQVRHALVIQDFFDLKRIANPAPAMAAIETAM